MKKNNRLRSFLKVLPAVLISVVCSCGSETFEEVQETSEGFAVSITLAGQGSASTRIQNESDPYFGILTGSVEENYINKDDLYIMTFSIPSGETVLSGDSELLEVLWAPDGIDSNKESVINSNGEDVVLRTTLHRKDKNNPDLEIVGYNSDFCIVAIANVRSFSESNIDLSKVTYFKDLRDNIPLKYKSPKGNNSNWSWAPDNLNKRGIPLFGVKRVSLSGYNKILHNEANPYQLVSDGSPTLWMLRAFAKVTVSLADELIEYASQPGAPDIKIKSVSVGASYSEGFFVVPELNRMNGFKEKSSTGQVIKPYITDEPTEASPDSNLGFIVAPDGRKAQVFLPEKKLTGDKTTEINLTLKVGGTDKVYSFKFKESPLDESVVSNKECWKCILRNYTYDFRVMLDFRIVSVDPTEWENAFDNEFIFGQNNN